MRLARVRVDGGVWLARLQPQGVELLRAETSHPAADVLREALAADVDFESVTPVAVRPPEAVTLLSPVANPSKMLGVGLNYATHAAESGMPLPTSPTLFVKTPNALLDPCGVITVDAELTREPDYEVELAVVIGSRRRRIAGKPLSYVLGYTICNDVTARDIQRDEKQWTRAKSLNTFAPLGPWITTTDEVGAGGDLRLRCTLNGELMQNGTTEDMVFDVPTLVDTISQSVELEPGDVITTGTPPGVGSAQVPPRFLRDGDEVVCSIDGLGQLISHVRVLKGEAGL